MKRLFALMLALVVFSAEADTTNNLITGTGYTGQSRTGALNGANPRDSLGCCTGSGAYVDTSNGGAIYFSYNQTSVAQTIAINQALQGSGVQVGGYNYSWDYYNQDYNRGTLTSTIKLTNNTGSTIHSYSPAMGRTTNGWTPLSGTQTFTNPYGTSGLGNLSVSFTGRDDRGWAGYYGPAVRNVNLSLNYTVDPCATNPAYSPSCANYGTVNTSNNLVPNPTGYAVSGASIDQSYAINQALGLSGANVMIHGFQWGYQANANGPYCASWLIVCWDQRNPSVSTNVDITSSTGTSLYSVARTYTNSYNTTNYQYVFPSSRNLLSLGNFNFTATTNDTAYIGDMWSRALYTPDPCTVNPLSSTSCPGYQQAYQDQQCSMNPLYATTCPGYQQAYFTQQCSANPLYNAACPGYQQAYFTQQCNINPLYSVDCPGYAVAYHDQQCSISPLFMSDCPGYAQAYKNQQCSLNPLYATDCLGYQQAYFTQQCNLNGLYDRSCPNYGSAYATKNILSTNTTTTTTTTTTVPTVTVVTSTDTTTASNPASIAISDTNVSTAISTPSTTSATSPTSVTSVVTTTAPVSTAASPTAAATAAATAPVVVTPTQAAATAAENKKTDTAVASVEKKSGGNVEAARKEATAKAKELATEAGKAATLEAQAATQGLVVGLMGYVPGFSAYQNSIVPDVNIAKMTRQYNKPVIDNRNAQRRLSGASDAKWQEMVDSQYKTGDK